MNIPKIIIIGSYNNFCSMLTSQLLLIIIATYIYATGPLSRPSTYQFSAVPGTNLTLPKSATPLQYLQLFFTMSVWQHILQTTNSYARQHLSATPPSRKSNFRNWREITLTEIKAFTGLIIQIGMVQLTDIKDYWSTHSTLSFPFFKSVF